MSFDKWLKLISMQLRLNPFRAGRCLSTQGKTKWLIKTLKVSIPFEQGDVFRLSLIANL